jgi:hypothetical protein
MQTPAGGGSGEAAQICRPLLVAVATCSLLLVEAT